MGNLRLRGVMKRRAWIGLAGVGMMAWGMGALAQTHAVKKPETVVRALAVYEWTGEEGKPTASRIVPVSIFINSQLQDAGVYLARPVPFALSTGTIYETQKSGVTDGSLELAYERHLTAGDTELIDDGWLGYGPFKPKPKEVLVAKKQKGPLPKIQASTDDSKPHFAGKQPASSGDAGTSATAKTEDDDDSKTRADSNRPTFHRAPGSSPDDSTTTASTSTKPVDPDADPDSDVERPTLKRRTPAEIKANQKKKDSAKVVGGTDLNDDPDRPNLHRGKPASRMEEDDLPPLRGIPKDMHQLVAVSDAKDRAEHDFRRAWDSDAEKADVTAKMQEFARTQLAAYKDVPTATPAATKSASTHTTAAHPVTRKRVASALPAPVTLADEVLNGYTLSYGGAATYFYTATSPGANGSTRYVTVVAQDDAPNGLKLALASVTDSAHLDRTPWMRLVDVVDAEASNRASLLLELRAQHTRQFALYRVIGAQAEQVFTTGSTE